MFNDDDLDLGGIHGTERFCFDGTRLVTAGVTPHLVFPNLGGKGAQWARELRAGSARTPGCLLMTVRRICSGNMFVTHYQQIDVFLRALLNIYLQETLLFSDYQNGLLIENFESRKYRRWLM